jgi:hypothetical protein
MTESMFELRTFGSDTMLNHYLSQKLKLIGNQYFNTNNENTWWLHKPKYEKILKLLKSKIF